MQNLHKIAQVLKSNGTDGELILGFRDIAPEDINVEEPVFIFFDGLPVPFFIESFQKKGQSKAAVRLTGVRSFADAEEIAGQPVYADADRLDPEYEDGFSFLTGWMLLDADGTALGRISGYLDIPGNPCIEVSVSAPEEKDVIIPLHEDLILSADEKKQELTMSVPAGLI